MFLFISSFVLHWIHTIFYPPTLYLCGLCSHRRYPGVKSKKKKPVRINDDEWVCMISMKSYYSSMEIQRHLKKINKILNFYLFYFILFIFIFNFDRLLNFEMFLVVDIVCSRAVCSSAIPSCQCVSSRVRNGTTNSYVTMYGNNATRHPPVSPSPTGRKTLFRQKR